MDEVKQNLWVANPKLKTLLLIFIFIFLFSGVGLVVFAQMQNNYRQQIYQETVNSLPSHDAIKSDVQGWTTYKNDQYGFEMKYPPTWHLTEKGDKLYLCPNDSCVMDSTEGLMALIYADTIKNPADLDLRTFIEKVLKLELTTNRQGLANGNQQNPNAGASLTDAIVDGHKALWIGAEGRSRASVMIAGPGVVVNINLESDDVEVFKKIVSTFEFIKNIDTSNWKTYKNDQYGFEFKYPSEIDKNKLTYRESENNSSLSVYLEAGEEFHLTDFTLTPGVTMDERLAVYKSIEKEVKTGKTKTYTDYTVTPVIAINIAGVPGKQFSIIAAEMGSTQTLITLWEFNGNLYSFQYSSFENQPYLDTYNQILSTFKFTKSVDTSNWKTYKNDQYGFEFMYPDFFVKSTDIENSLVAFKIQGYSCVSSVNVLEQNLDERLKSIQSQQLLSYKKENFSVGDVHGIKVLSEIPEGGLIGVTILLPYNSKIYEFDYCQEGDLEQLFDKILPTIKFTK